MPYSDTLHLILTHSLIATVKKRPQQKDEQETTVFIGVSAACNYSAQWTTPRILMIAVTLYLGISIVHNNSAPTSIHVL